MEKNRNILRLIAVGLLLSIIIIGIACPFNKKSNDKETAVGTSVSTPSVPSGNWSRLAAGNAYTVSLKTTGTLWAWGPV